MTTERAVCANCRHHRQGFREWLLTAEWHTCWHPELVDRVSGEGRSCSLLRDCNGPGYCGSGGSHFEPKEAGR